MDNTDKGDSGVAMNRLQLPWLFMGPTGSGKLTQVRQWIEAAHGVALKLPLESRTFTVGDGYEARVLASPYHFEIDIPNLSMQDKQIIGDLLTTFFSSGDVFSSLQTGTRKLVILRRAHSLSLPAAIRVRAIIQQYVLPPEARGMLWLTAREMSGSLALLEDAFVRYRVPRMSLDAWATHPDIPAILQSAEAWDRCNGRVERVKDIVKFFPDGRIPAWPRRIHDFYNETMEILLAAALSSKPPTLDVVYWVRARIYQVLSLCQNGPDIIDSYAAALQHHAHMLEPAVFWAAMSGLVLSEPHTSYRTPLALEAALLSVFEVVNTQKTKSIEKTTPLAKDHAVAATAVTAAAVVSPINEVRFDMDPATVLRSEAIAVAVGTTSNTKSGRRRTAPRKKKTGGE
jgi:hypothetical protein